MRPEAQELQSSVRTVLSSADGLSRRHHRDRSETTAQHLAAIRTKLGDVDLELGRTHEIRVSEIDAIHDLVLKLRRHAHEGPELEPFFEQAGHLEHRLRGHPDGAPEALAAARRERRWRWSGFAVCAFLAASVTTALVLARRSSFV